MDIQCICTSVECRCMFYVPGITRIQRNNLKEFNYMMSPFHSIGFNSNVRHKTTIVGLLDCLVPLEIFFFLATRRSDIYYSCDVWVKTISKAFFKFQIFCTHNQNPNCLSPNLKIEARNCDAYRMHRNTKKHELNSHTYTQFTHKMQPTFECV